MSAGENANAESQARFERLFGYSANSPLVLQINACRQCLLTGPSARKLSGILWSFIPPPMGRSPVPPIVRRRSKCWSTIIFPPRHLPHRTNKLLNFLIELFCDSLTWIDFGQVILRISFAEPCTVCGVGLTLQDAIRARQSTYPRIHVSTTQSQHREWQCIRGFDHTRALTAKHVRTHRCPGCTIIFFRTLLSRSMEISPAEKNNKKAQDHLSLMHECAPQNGYAGGS